MPAKDTRIIITMACTDCRSRTYTTFKNRQKHPDRLELKKFCPRCRKHVMHREAK
ncbi:MAG: 50S ribosomal protein L33 [Armatimonadetes bacterium]|nr:50S ribosomal protein L33 [Armatimonadota bacterium]